MAKGFREQLNHTYIEDTKSGTIKACGGETGNGGESLIVDDLWTLSKASYFTYPVENVAQTLVSTDWKDPQCVGGISMDNKKVIRRLTPVECGRLQGFPDDWCEGVEGSDAAQYKMWGNGVALPCVLYIMEGIAECDKEENNG